MKRILFAVLAFACMLGLSPVPARAQISDAALLDSLQYTAFRYFWVETNPANGLIRDRSTAGSPASIAATGFGLSAMCIGADHGWITRQQARDRVLTTLNTFVSGPQGSGPTGIIGYKGLFYHFLDMNTARRTWTSELSTIDTALLFAGILDARQYFNGADPNETLIRTWADSIVHRADWNFMRNLHPYVVMGWKPNTEGGFSNFGGWIGYNEGLLLYVIASGSPTHPVPNPAAWNAWTSGYQWQTWYGYDFAVCPPLFTHQYPACWVDFRDKRDAYMLGKNSDYFQNSVRASLAQVEYARQNPNHMPGYSDSLWGLTASDDPAGYAAHGAPNGYDDGVISPTAGISSLPFTPVESMRFARNLWNNYRSFHAPANPLYGVYGFKDGFSLGSNWVGTDYLGIDQGPVLMMIENHRTSAVWNRMMTNPDIVSGLANAGFQSYVLGVGEPHEPAASLQLSAPSPNPLRSSGAIAYSLPRAGRVHLSVYDVSGREVARLVDADQSAGAHRVDFHAGGLPNGVYLTRVAINGAQRTQRCVVLH